MRAHEFDSILCTQLNKILPAYGWHTGEHIGSGNEAVDVSGKLPNRRVYIEVELRRDEPLTNVIKLWIWRLKKAIEEEGHTNEVILVHAFSGKYSPSNAHRTHAEFIGTLMQRGCGVTYVPLGQHGSRWTARVKNYGEVLEEYEYHPEAKCADSQGNPCDKQTVGLLQRRHIRIDQIKFIGKESSVLEDVESGREQSAQNVYTEYVDPRRDEWTTKGLQSLKKAPLKLLEQECKGLLSRRAIIDLRAGRSRPHRKTRDLLVAILKKLGLL